MFMKKYFKKSIILLLVLISIFSMFSISYANNEEPSDDIMAISTEDLIMPRTNDDTELLEDNAYIMGDEDTVIDYPIAGDLFIINAGKLTISSSIYGNVYAIADELVITETGYINSLYCISNKLEISGNVDTSVYAISKTFIQNSTSTIWRDLHLTAQDVKLSGYVERDSNIACENMEILSTTYLGRDLNYSSNQEAIVAENAYIGGNTNFTLEDSSDEVYVMPLSERIKSFVLSTVRYLVIVIVLLFLLKWISSKSADKCSDLTKNNLGNVIANGLLVLFVLPIAIFISLIIVIGLPLSLLLICIYLLAIVLSTKFAIIALSELLTKKLDKWNCKYILKQLLVITSLVLAYKLLKLLPIVDIIISLGMGVYGLGIIVSLIFPSKDKKVKTDETKTEIVENIKKDNIENNTNNDDK